MAFALHRWNRATLLARLEANEAIDDASSMDPAQAARERLRLLAVGDRFEAAVISDDEAIAEFRRLRDDARRIAVGQPVLD
ncbi:MULTISPECIES: hypothetical protein [unclassified Curtobacterium]|uniref:hypothetical protein n=1 Tax=unclassified Curtobacterium TaxID=257496 RepID=UPI000DA7022D|nr:MULTISPECIES: hypothetical protein [unclassified Curtobacterium]PZE24775.1 hypothetical protein DEI86_12130 [Curtobacterium sp. MCBD17_028]PZE73841.1 hypothetical protein DEI82_12295 [Curtobacterium sp. MCBD17_019]PZF56636.1 hypothetical protein DEI92_14145 [Curtobacterium sp. MCBD17_034]PZF60475.1 hypothetical protein DEI81_13065 [Curtobacterium sp. MCBD17_013]PZM33331.1 hypothetical protein DEI90_13740 [Curtobacterium sp. MCBD17_031]